MQFIVLTTWGMMLSVPKQQSYRTGETRWGGCNCIARTALGVDYRVNAIPRAKRGEMRASFQQPEKAAHWGIPGTVNNRPSTRPGGGAESLTG